MARKLPGKTKKPVAKAAATAAAAAATAAAAAGAAKVVASVKRKKAAAQDPPCKKTPNYLRPVEVTLRYEGPKGQEVIVRIDPGKVQVIAWDAKAVDKLAEKRDRELPKKCPSRRPDGIKVLKPVPDIDSDSPVGGTKRMMMMNLEVDSGRGREFGGCYMIDGQLICWGESIA